MTYWVNVVGKNQERAHSAWLDRGRTGEGRIAVSNHELEGIRLAGVDWTAVQFTGCRFVDCRIAHSDLSEAEIVDCTFEKSELGSCTFEKAELRGCRAQETVWPLSRFYSAQITNGDFSGNHFGRALFNGAVVRTTRFQRATLGDARLDDAELVDCDFSGADFSKVDTVLDLSTSFGTRFIRCDLRDTRWERRTVVDAVFEDCKVAGIAGKPILGRVTVVRPDFSAAGDGSDIRDADALLAAWRKGT